ncbi:MAG: diguanylate cyclase domain-containing protein [Aeromonadaceae bacterium]
MPSSKPPASMPKRYYWHGLPWLILVIGTLLSCVLFASIRQHNMDVVQHEFAIRTGELVAGFERRIAANSQLLSGVGGLFASRGNITRHEFQRYIQELQLSENYPGIQAIGYVALIPAAQKEYHVNAMHAQGFANYEIHPAGDRESYAAVVYIEPYTPQNQQVLGFDISQAPILQQIAEQARESGLATMTPKLIIPAHIEQQMQAAVQLFVPVYRAATPLLNKSQRKAALQGWLYSQLQIGPLLDHYLAREYPSLGPKIAIRLYASAQTTPATLMYSSYQDPGELLPKHEVTRHITVGGATWSFTLIPRTSYLSGELSQQNGLLVLLVGLTLTLSFALITLIVVRSHQRIIASLTLATEANRNQAKQENLLRAIYDNSGIALVLLDIQGHIAFANSRTAELLHLSPDTDLTGKDYYQILSEEERDESWALLQELLNGSSQVVTRERCLVRHDQSVFWAAITSRIFLDANGESAGVIVVIEDITARRENETAMRLARTVVEASPGGIMVTDANHRIVSVNPAFTRITGYRPEDVIGKNPKVLGSGLQNKAFYHRLWQSIEQTGYWEGELINRHKNGHLVPELMSISRVRNSSGQTTNYVGMFMDITERRKAEERIQYLAHHDYLTNLANRASLVDRAEQALLLAQRNQRRMAIIFIDLDRFKPINDLYGHDVGDQVLCTIAERLQKTVRSSDTVCRQGGDEFVILLPEYQQQANLVQLANKLLMHIEQPCAILGHHLSLSASIGIATYPEDGQVLDDIIQQADAAMYRAKSHPENHICFASWR